MAAEFSKSDQLFVRVLPPHFSPAAVVHVQEIDVVLLQTGAAILLRVTRRSIAKGHID
jgi:hypothetical protein